jgi:hypothetical protein
MALLSIALFLELVLKTYQINLLSVTGKKSDDWPFSMYLTIPYTIAQVGS